MLQVVAIDKSIDALRVTLDNIRTYELPGRVHPACADLLSAVKGPFDLVIANLPYLPSSSLDTLQPEVTVFEPRQALDGGAQGLDLIERLCGMLAARLCPTALVLLEIDEGQGEAVVSLLNAALPGAVITVLYDYAGLERIVSAELTGKAEYTVHGI